MPENMQNEPPEIEGKYIAITNESELPVPMKALYERVERLYKHIGEEESEVSIVLMTDEDIRALNKEWREHIIWDVVDANRHGRLEKWTFRIRENIHHVGSHASRKHETRVLQELYLATQHGQHLVGGIELPYFLEFVEHNEHPFFF